MHVLLFLPPDTEKVLGTWITNSETRIYANTNGKVLMARGMDMYGGIYL